MINSFFKLKDLLEKDEIRLIGPNKNNIIRDYSFFHISEAFDIDKNQIIFQYFIESPVIIINKLFENDCNPRNEYFIISFKKTVLIINQTQVIFLQPLFTKNTDAKFCFLLDCQNIFIQNCQIQVNSIQCDQTFINEIRIFRNSIFTYKSPQANISKNLQVEYLINSFNTSIIGYLIKQSYSKLNARRDFYFKTNKNPEETIFDKNDFIPLRLIGIGNVFKIMLIYHIEKEELFEMKSPCRDYDNVDKLINREINNYRQMNHPLIPKYYGTIKGKNRLIIEYINDRTLDNIERNMHLNENDKHTIFFQLLIIFNYLHKNEFVYRDLKPNNVIIDEKKRIYLINFDQMIKISDESRTRDFMSVFVSPNVEKGINSYSNDIYSLYMMMFYIITGKNCVYEYIIKDAINLLHNLNYNLIIIYLIFHQR